MKGSNKVNKGGCNGSVTEITNNFVVEKANPPQAESIINITTPDAEDEATAIALANANKSKINEMLDKFRTAGIIEE